MTISAQQSVTDSYTLEQPAEQVPAMGELETPRGREALIPVIDFQKMPPEKAVLAAYAKLERLIRASGAEISIELSEIAVWDRSQFDTLTWASIAEYPEEGAIHVTRYTKTHFDGQRSVSYKASWSRGGAVWYGMAEPFRQDQRSVAEVLREAGAVEPAALSFDTLVTFEVEVVLERRRKQYRAGMFLAHDSSGIRNLHPLELVLQRVDSAIEEDPMQIVLTDEVVEVPDGLTKKIEAAFGKTLQRVPYDPSNGGSGNPPSPILIALEPGQFALTGLDDPVSFDIDADGYSETIGWSTRDGDEAFLVLDRDGNGLIDDGSELFGNYTEQPESPEPNGFLALAAFDDGSLGGNADGEISAEDAVFAELRLWHDIDHDGISDPDELEPLSDSGILSISLSPVRSERRDRHGNFLRYASHVRFTSGPQQRLAAVDVFFVAQDGP